MMSVALVMALPKRAVYIYVIYVFMTFLCLTHATFMCFYDIFVAQVEPAEEDPNHESLLI